MRTKQNSLKIFVNLRFVLFIFTFILYGCSNLQSTGQNETQVSPSPKPSISATQNETARIKPVIDVPNLANKPAEDFEKIFGKSVKITTIKNVPEHMPGEYRLYKVVNHPDGLSVRFYKNRALRFNLFLSEQTESPKDALLKTFGIDVKDAASTKTQFVEKWAGEFNSIKFKTAYAMKKDINSSKYAMVHAEVEQ
jgi:hypothetical protein